MRNSIILLVLFLSIGCKNETKKSTPIASVKKQLSEEFVIINQDYNKALEIAARENKMIFVDFYTTWCAPCKKLDKLVFKNDSVQKVINKDFILLKYDAENDSVFHLSKKYHVNSYPTAIILNKNGYLLKKQSGFVGEDYSTLSKSVFKFNEESIALNRKNGIVKGYSNKIDENIYPKFYNDYVNRTNTNTDASELNEYWTNHTAIFSESYFAPLIYFASEASDEITNKTINNKEKYAALYGENSVNTMVIFLIYGKFDRAIEAESKSKFEEAISYAEIAIEDKKTLKTILFNSQIDFLKKQDKWNEVFENYKIMKGNGEMSNGYVNHFSWQVYRNCTDKNVIKKCTNWMKEVVEKEPTYQYLETYAYLSNKSGDKKETKLIANLALKAAKKEGESTKSIEKLLAKL
jgi:thiol-disulfide isomerase/thioredoxin